MSDTNDPPPGLSRRGLLGFLGVGAVGVGAVAAGAAATTTRSPSFAAPVGQSPSAAQSGAAAIYPFHGEHQSGIVTPA